MGIEIERKFLLANDSWRSESVSHQRLVQGYLSRGENGSVRIRIKGTHAELNIKSTRDGIHRLEYEYGIPLSDAEEMVEKVALKPLINKTRYIVEHAGHRWEIDEFHAENTGLVLAEIELDSADEAFERPSWVGEEVSTDPRYFNTYLSEHPYTRW